jgi:hypothetical protein
MPDRRGTGVRVNGRIRRYDVTDACSRGHLWLTKGVTQKLEAFGSVPVFVSARTASVAASAFRRICGSILGFFGMAIFKTGKKLHVE